MPTCRKRKGRETWAFTFDADPEAGTRRQITRGGFPNKDVCLAALYREMVARGRTGYVEPSTQKVKDYLAEWLEGAASSLAGSTQASYAGHIDGIAKHIGHLLVGKLSSQHIQRCYLELGKTWAPTTVRQAHTVLHAALEQGVKWGTLERNPAHYVTLPAVPPSEVQVWTEEEARRFLTATAEHADYPLWRLYLDTGMRVGEGLGLAWNETDLDSATVRIRRTLARDRSEQFYINVGTKHGSNRLNEVNDLTVRALRRQRVEQLKRRLQVGELWQDMNLVFDRGDGHFYNPCVVREHFIKACTIADVPVIQLKALRHTAATIMVANGVPLHAVKERLGHSTIKLTADLYAHSTRKADRLATETLARVFGD